MKDVTGSRMRLAGFSLPALPLNGLIVAVFVFLPALYAEDRGLGPATVGLVFLVAKLFDIVSAPMCGLLMDGYKTPFGRRRPWLALSVPLLALAVYMIYR